MRALRSWLLGSSISLLIFATGCSNPTGPSASPLAPPASFTIAAPTNVLKIRESVTFVATGTFQDGTTRPVSAFWTTDTPAVATVDRQGIVTGVGAGRANIIATLNGQPVVQSVRVVPSYDGRWFGPLVLVTCVMGDPRTCGRSYPVGATGTLTLDISQNRAAVAARLEFTYHVITFITNFISNMVGSLTGTILDDGRLVLDGRLQLPLPNGSFSDASTLWNWSSAADATGATMSGSFQELGFSFGFVQRVGWTFGPLTRVASP